MSKQTEPGYSHVLKDIAESSSVHGIPKIVSSRQLPVKILWFLLALVTFGVMSYQLYNLIIEFNSNPVVTRVGLKFSNLRYPDVTFCNMNPLRKSKLKTLSAAVKGVNSPKPKKPTQDKVSLNSQSETGKGKPIQGADPMTSDGRTKRRSHETNSDGPIHDKEPPNNIEPSKDNGDIQGVNMANRPARAKRQSEGITESVTDGLDDVLDEVVDTATDGPTGDEDNITHGPFGDEDTTNGPTADEYTSTYGPAGDDDTADTFYIEHWDYYSDYYDDDDDETDTENGTFVQETPIMAGMPTYGDDVVYEAEDDYDEDHTELLKTPKDGLKSLRDKIKTKIKQAPSELIKALGHQKEDMVISFSFAGRKQKIPDIEQVTSPHYGNCYKISSKKYKAWRSGPDHGLKLILNLETGEYMSGFASGYGIRVAFNEPGSLAMPNEEGITVSSGFDTSIGLRTVQISRLAEPYGKCSDGAEFFKRYNRKYTVAACMEFCRVDQVIETCRCIPFDAPETYSNADYDTIDVCKPLPHKDEACVIDVEFKLDDGEAPRCDCPSACNEIVYDKALSGRFWPTDDYLSKGLMREVCKRNIASMAEACSQRKNGTFDPALYKKDFLTIRIYYEDLNYESIAEEPMYGDYTKALTPEAVGRLLFAEFETRVLGHTNPTHQAVLSGLKQVAKDPNQNNLTILHEDEGFVQIRQKYQAFKEDVKQGHIDKTAQFWIDYTDSVWLLLRLVREVKENNITLYIQYRNSF